MPRRARVPCAATVTISGVLTCICLHLRAPRVCVRLFIFDSRHNIVPPRPGPSHVPCAGKNRIGRWTRAVCGVAWGPGPCGLRCAADLRCDPRSAALRTPARAVRLRALGNTSTDQGVSSRGQPVQVVASHRRTFQFICNRRPPSKIGGLVQTFHRTSIGPSRPTNKPRVD
jgi:hypothetical protein